MNAVAGCQGKSRFPTWRQANRTAVKMNRRKDQEGHVAPYKCKVCSFYHIGRTDPNERHVNKQRRRKFFEER